MDCHHYTPEQIEFLRANVKGCRYKELTKMLNKHFGLQQSEVSIKSALKYRKISNGLPAYRDKRIIDPEQEKYLTENIKGHSYRKLTKMFNEHFGLNLSFRSMCKVIVRLNLHNGLTGGHLPVGTEVNHNGYIKVKIAEPSVWRSKHIVIWEAANGSIPEGYRVIFADGNKLNFDLNNIILVSNRQHAMLNRHRITGDTIEQTKTGIAIVDIYLKIADLKKQKKSEET